MSRFIKLTDMILNIRHVTRILIKHDKYKIYMGERIDTYDYHDNIEICAKNRPIDYMIVKKWIDKCDKV